MVFTATINNITYSLSDDLIVSVDGNSTTYMTPKEAGDELISIIRAALIEWIVAKESAE